MKAWQYIGNAHVNHVKYNLLATGKPANSNSYLACMCNTLCEYYYIDVVVHMQAITCMQL